MDQPHSAATNKNKNGFVLLILMIGVLFVVIVISFAISRSSSLALFSNYNIKQQDQSRVLVDACLEEALFTIKNNNNFSGGATVAISSYNCQYNVVVGAGENRTITASSTVGASLGRGRASITQINPTIKLSEWREIP